MGWRRYAGSPMGHRTLSRFALRCRQPRGRGTMRCKSMLRTTGRTRPGSSPSGQGISRLVDPGRGSSVQTPLSPSTLRNPRKPNPSRPMEEQGENWGSILAETLKSPARTDLIEAMNQITSDIDDVKVKAVGGYLLVQFRHGSSGSGGKGKERWFDAFQESDGPSPNSHSHRCRRRGARIDHSSGWTEDPHRVPSPGFPADPTAVDHP